MWTHRSTYFAANYILNLYLNPRNVPFKTRQGTHILGPWHRKSWVKIRQYYKIWLFTFVTVCNQRRGNRRQTVGTTPVILRLSLQSRSHCPHTLFTLGGLGNYLVTGLHYEIGCMSLHFKAWIMCVHVCVHLCIPRAPLIHWSLNSSYVKLPLNLPVSVPDGTFQPG